LEARRRRIHPSSKSLKLDWWFNITKVNGIQGLEHSQSTERTIGHGSNAVVGQ
jgi:hypothetical protein